MYVPCVVEQVLSRELGSLAHIVKDLGSLTLLYFRVIIIPRWKLHTATVTKNENHVDIIGDFFGCVHRCLFGMLLLGERQ